MRLVELPIGPGPVGRHLCPRLLLPPEHGPVDEDAVAEIMARLAE
jgi:hypothetical protein